MGVSVLTFTSTGCRPRAHRIASDQLHCLYRLDGCNDRRADTVHGVGHTGSLTGQLGCCFQLDGVLLHDPVSGFLGGGEGGEECFGVIKNQGLPGFQIGCGSLDGLGIGSNP